MSEYKGIKGFQVQTRTEDPVPYAQALADNPYAGSWSSGGDLNTARSNQSGFGTQTSTISAGGYTTTDVAVVESYNGTSFTEVADLNSARRATGSAGSTNTAGITFGGGGGGASPGTEIALNESWNGSSWTEVGDLSTGRQLITGTGTQTAALAIGGGANPGQAKVESWDGSSWTEIADLNQLRNAGAASGLQPSAVFFGGYTTTDVANTENWNGSSWTEVSDLNTARSYLGGSDLSYTAALAFGGADGTNQSATTETWNGSAWTEVADMATGRNSVGGTGGSNISALVFGGYDGSTRVTNTEEWSFSGLDPSTTPAADYANAITGDFYYNSTTGQFKTVNDGGAPIGTWASGGTLNASKSSQANIGNSKANNTAGGQNPSSSYLTQNEQYDGTSWTEVNDLNTGRQVGAGIGTSAAGLIASGRPVASGGAGAQNESWNGTSFTEEADLNTGRGYGRGAGTQTAGIVIGGFTNPPAVRYANVETWNGSAWTETTDLNAVRSSNGIAQGSPYTSTIVFGGDTGPGPSTTSSIATAETWDGSSWTEVSDLNEGRRALGGAGDSISSALAFGGSSVNTEFWNGSSWTEVNNLSDARSWGGNSGSSLDALVCGDEPFSGATEEWTAAEFQIKTVTTS